MSLRKCRAVMACKRKLLIWLATIMVLCSGSMTAYADETAVSEQKFLEFCEENNADHTRYLYPPLKEPAPDSFNYEYHYREVLKYGTTTSPGTIISSLSDVAATSCMWYS